MPHPSNSKIFTVQIGWVSSGYLVDLGNLFTQLMTLVSLSTQTGLPSLNGMVWMGAPEGEDADARTQQAVRSATIAFAASILESQANLCHHLALALESGQLDSTEAKAKLSQANLEFLHSRTIALEDICRPVVILAELLGETNPFDKDERFQNRLNEFLQRRSALIGTWSTADNIIRAQRVLEAFDIQSTAVTVLWYLAAMLSLSVFVEDPNHDALIQQSMLIWALALNDPDSANLPWSNKAHQAMEPVKRQLQVQGNAWGWGAG
jgi:hypothetical protein